MSIIVIATITPLPQFRDAVFETILESVPAIHGEAGCELYAVHDTGQAVLIVEQWSDAATLDAHGVSPAVQKVQAAIDGKLVEAPVLVRATALPAGAPLKGRLVRPRV